jgi:hypothetical protein
MKHWSVLVAAITGLVLLWVWRAPPPERGPDGVRPWEVHRGADGSVRALGLTPGRSTLAEAIARHGKGLEAAVFESPGRPPVVEAYWSEVSAGGVTGRLVLGLAAPAAVVDGLLARSAGRKRLGTGSARAEIQAGDAEVVAGLPVRSITFVPRADLDEAVVRARFGEPSERIESAGGVAHWLYPDRGLAVTLSERGRELIDYVDPADFGWLREALGADRGRE